MKICFNKHLHLSCAVAFALIPLIIRAQSATPVSSINVIPPAPNASSLGKYADIPVSYYTGIPQISVPLTSVNVKDCPVDISLSYHASGLKVEENASWVGLGWSLNAGGVITRTVRGLPDEIDDGYHLGYDFVRTEIKKYRNGPYTDDQKAHFHEMLASGRWDGEPDQYFFNFNGRTGKIFFDLDGVPSLIPAQKLKVTGSAAQGFFTITDEKGIAYGFSANETTYQEDACDFIPVGAFSSSWYLTDITLPSGDLIEFGYDIGTTYQNIIPQETIYNFVTGASTSGSCPPMSSTPCKKVYKVDTRRLWYIRNGKTQIKFNALTKRTDLPQGSNEYRLDNIEVLYDSVVSKKFVFTYSVFGCSKLKLDKVQEISGSQTIAPYSFQYINAEAVPCSDSKQQDHWGFYNDNQAGTLVPPGFFITLSGNRVDLPGADRSPSGKVVTGMLEKITYPTGGSTSFQYNGNTYGYQNQTPILDYELIPMVANALATPSNPIETYVFTTNMAQKVYLDYMINQGVEPGDYPSVNEWVQLKDLTNNEILAMRSYGTGSSPIFLPIGTYELTAYSENPDTRTTAGIGYFRKSEIPKKNKGTGGIRIASITDYDGINANNNIVRTFKYIMPDEPDRSSGVVSMDPKYDYDYRLLTGVAQVDCQYYVRTSVANFLGSTQGGNVGYRSVTVLRNDSAKSVYWFTSFYDYSDAWNIDYPFALPTSYDHSRGKLMSSIDYKKVDTVYQPVRRVINDYEFADPRASKNSIAYKIGYRVHNPNSPLETEYSIQAYFNVSEWSYLKSTTEQYFSSLGKDSVVKQTSYFYDNATHMQPTRIEQSKSDGRKEVLVNIYPLDYASGTTFIDDMNTKHLVAYPVEEVNCIADAGNAIKVRSGKAIEYKPGGKGQKNSEYFQELPTALALSDFKFSSRAKGVYPSGGTPALFQLDPTYKKRLDYSSYDPKGNLLQYAVNNSTISYLWGYDNNYPIAEAKNASQTDIAYTSFEEEGNGNWSVASSLRVNNASITGSKCYELSNGQISKTSLVASTEYIVSFWTKPGASVNVSNTKSAVAGTTINGWIYNERIVGGSTTITISGSGNIDELRIYPRTAQMSTYTYEPLKGMSSQCDASNRIIYYEYDSLGRLALVKDQNGKILKQYDYQFQKPITQ